MKKLQRLKRLRKNEFMRWKENYDTPFNKKKDT